MTPPPGWYRDPMAPYQERWWDGTAWTEHRRAPQAPGQPPQPPPSAGGGTASRAKATALTAAGVVLVAAIVTGAVVVGKGDGEHGSRARTAPTARTPTPVSTSATASPSSSPSGSAPSVVVDQLNGIVLPVPHGWVTARDVADDTVVMTTDGTYDCPDGAGLCRHGLVSTHTATQTDATSPKALARQDIADAANTAYDRDAAGERPFGGITSHRVVASGQIVVAGRVGYYVRWQVKTAAGPGGYVQSLSFPSSVGTESPVVVRFAFDAGPGGPPLSDMDTITRGIRALGDADTGGGVGSSIGPSH